MLNNLELIGDWYIHRFVRPQLLYLAQSQRLGRAAIMNSKDTDAHAD